MTQQILMRSLTFLLRRKILGRMKPRSLHRMTVLKKRGRCRKRLRLNHLSRRQKSIINLYLRERESHLLWYRKIVSKLICRKKRRNQSFLRRSLRCPGLHGDLLTVRTETIKAAANFCRQCQLMLKKKKRNFGSTMVTTIPSLNTIAIQ